MTLEALKTLLDTTGFPVSYSSVPLEEATETPYICYSQENTNVFPADGVAYYMGKSITIRLYTKTRDEISEGKVETALQDMIYTKEPAFLDDQKIYEITYGIEV